MKTKVSRQPKRPQKKALPQPAPIDFGIDCGKVSKVTRGGTVGFTSEQGWPPFDRYPG